jgi:polysaccharide chain length determinant protein (PEP-CTERM system associated)
MQETFHQLVDELYGALRYKWPAMGIAWAACLLGWALAMVLPNVYESNARIFADTSTALTPVIKGLAIEQDVTAQLNLVEQSLLSEAQLNQVIDQAKFSDEPLTPGQRARIMARLRSQIQVNVRPATADGGGSGAVYWLSYRDPSRERSLKVLQLLVDNFVRNTLGGKMQNSADAQKFLVSQIAESEQRLREAEDRLAAFKKGNLGTMPGKEGDYFTRLQNEMDAARKARTDLSIAASRRDELAKQLRDGAVLAASSGAAVGAKDRDGGKPRDTLSQLEDARAELDQLLRTFTERHPDVAVLREKIADLESKHQEELTELRRGDNGRPLPTGVTANPVYQSVRLALNEASVEVAALSRTLASHDAEVDELRRLVNTMPEVEAEFARLNRDYDVQRSQYSALVERLEQIRLGQDAERTNAGIVMEVLDPPTASVGPVAPNRPMLITLVFLASLGLGAGLAWVLSKLNPVFNRSHELEQITGLPVLGSVTLTGLDQVVAHNRRGYLRYAATAGALFLAFGAVLITDLMSA